MDPVYGVELNKFYAEKGIKEILAFRDQYDGRKLVYPRYLYYYQLINKKGQVIRMESSRGNLITRREDTEFSEIGEPIANIRYSPQFKNDNPKPGRDSVEWVRPIRAIVVTHPADTDYSSPIKRKTQPNERIWTSNDTSYIEIKGLSYPGSIDIYRTFKLGSDPRYKRNDHIHFSPKGMGEPSYYYEKIERGKIIEKGKVSFELELWDYLQRNPDDGQYFLGRNQHAMNSIIDKIARQRPGKFEPYATYRYDVNGVLLTQKVSGTQTTYVRDPKGRLVTEQNVYDGNQDKNITTYKYNEKGLLVKKTTMKINGELQEVITYQYIYY